MLRKPGLESKAPRTQPCVGRRTTLALSGLMLSLMASHAASSFRVTAFGRDGGLTWTNAPVPGVCTVLTAAAPNGPWISGPNAFATNSTGALTVPLVGGTRFHRMQAVDVPATAQ